VPIRRGRAGVGTRRAAIRVAQLKLWQRLFWNPELLDVVTYYNYFVLVLKLIYCMPELYPVYLDFSRAERGDECVTMPDAIGCQVI
jgi:hypothetical protein